MTGLDTFELLLDKIEIELNTGQDEMPQIIMEEKYASGVCCAKIVREHVCMSKTNPR